MAASVIYRCGVGEQHVSQIALLCNVYVCLVTVMTALAALPCTICSWQQRHKWWVEQQQAGTPAATLTAFS